MDKLSRPEALRVFAETYGVAVRAGVLTPNLDDERAIRAMFGLPPPSPEVVASWNESRGVRLPITLQGEIPQTTDASSKITSQDGN